MDQAAWREDISKLVHADAFGQLKQSKRRRILYYLRERELSLLV